MQSLWGLFSKRFMRSQIRVICPQLWKTPHRTDIAYFEMFAQLGNDSALANTAVEADRKTATIKAAKGVFFLFFFFASFLCLYLGRLSLPYGLCLSAGQLCCRDQFRRLQGVALCIAAQGEFCACLRVAVLQRMERGTPMSSEHEGHT